MRREEGMKTANFIVNCLMGRVLELAKFANEACVLMGNWDEDQGWF